MGAKGRWLFDGKTIKELSKEEEVAARTAVLDFAMNAIVNMSAQNEATIIRKGFFKIPFYI